jgi:solute carrier family 30 (zinc transporter), member 9
LRVHATTSSVGSKIEDIVIEKTPLDALPSPIRIIQGGDLYELPLPELKHIVEMATSTNDEAEKKLRQDLKASLDEKNKQLAMKRVRVDFSRSSLERNFITPVRAMSDFLLKPSDLENLAKTKRRSPYEQEPPITVYWRKDVEAKAIEIWGSRENLLKECLKLEIEKKKHQQSKYLIFSRICFFFLFHFSQTFRYFYG